MVKLSREIACERLYRNGLIKPFSSFEEVAYNLGGVQSQVQQFAEVAMMNRCVGSPTMRSMQRAYDEHRIINAWGQRKTLHMYGAKDWDTICDLYHDKTYLEKYLSAQSELVEKSIDLVRAHTDKGEVLLKEDFQAYMTSEAPVELSSEFPLTYFYQSYLSVNGHFFGVPAKPSIKHYAASSALGKDPWTFDPARSSHALDDMMLRYFRYYGPATIQDFCHWSGLLAGLAKPALSRLTPKLSVREFEGRSYYSYGEVEVKNTNKLILLGKFDPLFVSYRHKDWIVIPEQEACIWRSAAHVEAVILDGPKILGTWRHVHKGNRMSLCVEPMTRISDKAKARIKTKAARLARFWKKELTEVTYS